MSKIVLNDLTNTYNPVAINENFTRIEEEFQDKVLYRSNPIGEPNTLQSDVDVNGKKVFNILELSASEVVLAGVPIGSTTVAAVAAATTQAVIATAQATTATAQAVVATTQASNAAASAASVVKDGSNGIAGLTLFKINFKNALNTFISFFTNSNTAARTYTFQDRDGTIADNADLALKADLAGPTFTGVVALPTGSVGVTQALADNNTSIATTAFVQNRFASPPPIGNTVAGTGAFTTLSATGAITPSQTAGIVGTTTNNNANAGSVGEYVSNTSGSVPLTTAVVANTASLVNLPAGDWDIQGSLSFSPNAATIVSLETGSISTTSAVMGAFGTNVLVSIAHSAGNADVINTPITRISIAAPTTVYLVTQAVFSINTLAVFGFISARRVR